MNSKKIIERAGEIIAQSRYCALAQLNDEGYPTAATITPAKTEGIRRIYFCTGLGSNWVKRIEKCPHASVCFNSEEPLHNITLVGDIEVVTDLAVKQEMWYDGMGMYFSGP